MPHIIPMDRFSRYLKIVAWARQRYTVNGSLVVQIGSGPLSTAYSRIEAAAASRYLGIG